MAIRSDEVLWFGKCPKDPRNSHYVLNISRRSLHIYEVIFSATTRDTVNSKIIN